MCMCVLVTFILNAYISCIKWLHAIHNTHVLNLTIYEPGHITGSGCFILLNSKRRFSQRDKDLLEEVYKINHYPAQYDIRHIARQTNATYKKVYNWFQDRRRNQYHKNQRWKRLSPSE